MHGRADKVQRKRWLGQSLGEYAFILCLVAVAAIPAMGLFHQNLAQAFNDLLGLAGKGGNPALVATPPDPSLATTLSAGGGSLGGAVGASVTTGTGKTYFLPALPTDLVKVIQTVGVNGTSRMLASSLENLALQLQQTGDITPTDANLLIQMAQTGHKMAAIEKALEDQAIIAGGDLSQFQSVSYTVDGVTYPAGNQWNLASSLGVVAAGVEAGQEGELYLEMKNLLNHFNGSDTVQDPLTRQLVQAMADEILAVGQKFQGTVGGINAGNGTPSDLTSITASRITNTDSKVICTTGSGSDTGTVCTPR